MFGNKYITKYYLSKPIGNIWSWAMILLGIVGVFMYAKYLLLIE